MLPSNYVKHLFSCTVVVNFLFGSKSQQATSQRRMEFCFLPGEIHLQIDKRLPLRDPLGLATAQIYLVNSLQRVLETANNQVILLHNIILVILHRGRIYCLKKCYG